MTALRALLPRLGRARVAMPGITAIGVKELRGRMRGRRAFVSVTVYVLIVAGFAWMVGSIIENQVRQNFAFDSSYQSPAIGRGIFIALMFLQTLMVAVLAPASTAGTISGEREKQTLDLLAVTPISSVAIVVGKLFSALTWVFTLILASIPVTALVFVYGGVAPDDVFRGYLVLFIEAIAFGALGVFFSALLRRSGAATGLTFVGVLVATVGLSFVWIFLRTTMANNLDAAQLAAGRPSEAFLYLNPFVAQADVACGAEGAQGSWCQIIAEVTGANAIVPQPGPVMKGGVGFGPGVVGQVCTTNGAVTTCAAQAVPAPVAPDGSGGGVVVNDIAVAGGVATFRDRYWPRSVTALLLLAFAFTAAAVQLVMPTRRWRPRMPGLPHRSGATKSA